jgi:hypothetical protein
MARCCGHLFSSAKAHRRAAPALMRGAPAALAGLLCGLSGLRLAAVATRGSPELKAMLGLSGNAPEP